jgi:hypothetical protein
LAIKADHLGVLKGVISGFMRESSHSMVDPETAPEDVVQNAYALASHRLQQNIGLHADTAFIHGLQQQLSHVRGTNLNVGGRLMGSKEFAQIQRDAKLARQLQQAEDKATADPSAKVAPLAAQTAGDALIVDPTSRRARQNGLSNQPVDHNMKMRGGLASATTNKGHRNIDYQPPSYALPLGGQVYNSVQTPMRNVSPLPVEHAPLEQFPSRAVEHIPGGSTEHVLGGAVEHAAGGNFELFESDVAELSSHQRPVLSPRSQARATKKEICEDLHEGLKYRLVNHMKDRNLKRLYHLLFDDKSLDHIDAFVGSQLRNGRPPQELKGDHVLDELKEHLLVALLPSPSK